MRAIEAITAMGETSALCQSIGVSRASLYRRRRAPAILDLRHRTRLVAYAAHPERFVSGPPRPETLPTAVWINPPSNTTRQDVKVVDVEQGTPLKLVENHAELRKSG